MGNQNEERPLPARNGDDGTNQHKACAEIVDRARSGLRMLAQIIWPELPIVLDAPSHSLRRVFTEAAG